MKSHDLAQMLKEAPDLDVRVLDQEGRFIVVTGLVYGDGTVDLQTLPVGGMPA
jgi:nitrate reductase NapAB chaperone NapD